jgi:arsenate reductase
MKLYHNPRCSKSREGLAILRNANLDFEIVEYMKNPLTKEELSNIVKKLNIAPIDLVRKNESIWKENFRGQKLDNEQVLDAMVQYPKLIERPIFINGNLGVIGRPPQPLISII